MSQTTRTSRIINATPEKIYKALTDAKALEAWQAPDDMTGKVHSMDVREGGGYEMSLYYSDTEKKMQGKSSDKEDRFTTRFITLQPPHKIVEAVTFATDDPSMQGEMMIEITLQPVADGTNVTFLYHNIPIGIKPEDNDAGTTSSLEKLAQYVA